jgi:hypothetical protein
MPQLISTTIINGKVENHFISLNFRWPYQANVINMFDVTNNKIDDIPLIEKLEFFK